MLELWGVILNRKILMMLWVIFITLCIVGLSMLYRWHMRNLLIDETGKRLMAIAVTAASEFDPADLDQLYWARDMKKPAYQRVFRQLDEIRNQNPEIKYAYIMRPTDTEHLFIFVADANANYTLPIYFKQNVGD